MSNRRYNSQTRVKKMGGGMMMMKKPMMKNLKKVDSKKNPGLAKLPIEVRNKMGFAKKGGLAKKGKK
jgi:hypothetical protein